MSDHRLQPDHAPTPFSADEFALGCPDGRVIVTRTVTRGDDGDEETYARTVFGADQGYRVTMRYGPADVLGEFADEPSVAEVGWIDLQRHASFPQDRTRISLELIETEVGALECARYDVDGDGGGTMSFWFALDRPGQPVVYEAPGSRTEVVADEYPDEAVRVRQATVADAAALGSIHTRSWLAAYRGVMDDAFLDGFDEVERGKRWATVLSEPPDETRRILVAEVDGRVLGMATVGAARDTDVPSGQLWMLNLEPEAFGSGIARTLHLYALRMLTALGHEEAYLWVATLNPRARRFYEREGWHVTDREQFDEIGGALVAETMYRRTLE